MLFYRQLDYLDVLFLRIADGIPCSAGHAVVACDENVCIIDHEAVSYRHAGGAVALGKHRDLIAVIYYALISQAVIPVPAVGLSSVRHGGLERYIRVHCFELYHGLGTVHVAAERHAAYKVLYPRIVHGAYYGKELFLKLDAAFVRLVIFPWQLRRPVAGKAAAFSAPFVN